MGRRKPAIAEAVYVRWIDSSYQRGEADLDELDDSGVVLETAGFLVRETDDTLSIALDRYHGETIYRHIVHIPRVLVRQLIRIAITEPGEHP